MGFRSLLCILFYLFALLPTLLSAGEEYRVGAGDVLEVKVFGEEELSRTVRVSGDGLIALPLAGRIKVENLTALEIAEQITRLLAKDYLVNPQVSVNIQQYVSQQVQVMGSVKAPGNYNLTGRATLTTLLARAGGITDQGGKMLMVVRESSKAGEFLPPTRIDVYSLLNKGDRSLDMEVRGGDILFVPKANEVYVIGEITNPGSIVYQEGMTLLQAISKAGAFKPSAATNRVQIIRRVNGREEVIKVDTRRIQSGQEKDPILQPEDLITVPVSYF